MVIIQEGGKKGKRGRSCDAKCYNATGDKCTCVCGGMNHGQGVTTAIKKTRDYFRDNEPVEGCVYVASSYQRSFEFP
ncbi:hypothetical protein ES702_07345 [subsurface metagenome]